MTPKPKLLPCPICGRKVDFEFGWEEAMNAYKYDIGCSIDCKRCYLAMNRFKNETPQQLAERWNKRQSTQ